MKIWNNSMVKKSSFQSGRCMSWSSLTSVVQLFKLRDGVFLPIFYQVANQNSLFLAIFQLRICLKIEDWVNNPPLLQFTHSCLPTCNIRDILSVKSWLKSTPQTQEEMEKVLWYRFMARWALEWSPRSCWTLLCVIVVCGEGWVIWYVTYFNW